jgi:diguanylate cyclase (GGDEF)-like protein/PAS domain S-box-containing protein
MLLLYTSGIALALTTSKQSNSIKPTPIVIQGENDTLIVGSEQDFPPFATGLTDATAGGFTVELWQAVAAESGLKYTLRVLPFHKLLDEFKAGKIDVLINLNITDELHSYADFSVPHAIIQGGIFVRKGESNIRSQADLAGKSIIMMAADVEDKYANSHGLRKQIVLVNTAEEGLRLLSSGKHDAMLIGKLVGMQTLEALALNNIKVLKADAGFSQKFAIAVHKGQADLLGKINEGLALSKASGSYDALYEKWFGIYEPKALGWRDILKYLSPFLFLFLCLAQYAIYRRNIERKAAQQALQESEAHLRLSQISGGIGTWEADLLNHTQKWSENCTALLGFTATTNPTWDDFIALVHPEDRQYIINATQSHIEYGTPYDAEYRIITPAGKCRWIRSTGQVERDVTGKPIFMRGIAQDIHVRKLAEQALQKSEHTLSEVLENVDSYIYLKDIQGRYLYANAKVCALFNTTLDAIVGHGDEQFFDAEATEKIRLNDRQVLLEGKTVRAEETNLTTTNGAPTTYLVVKLPLRNDAGEIYGLCGISTEINDIKLMEIELLKNNSLLQSTLESTNDAILVVDLNNTWILHNQRFIDLWGIADDIMDAKDDNAALSSVLEQLVDADAFLNKVHELYATPEVSSFDTLKFKNGKIVERYSIPQLNDSKVVGRVWSFRDVTERKLAEEKLIKSESFSQAIIEASPVPFALNDADGNITYLNKAFVKTFGYNLSDIPTLAEWWPLAYPDLEYRQQITDHWQKNLQEAQRTKTPFQPLEINIQCKDGSLRTTICSATDVEDDFAGTHLVSLVDITERKVAEDKLLRLQTQLLTQNENLRQTQIMLQETRDRYIDLYEFAPVGYMAISNHGIISEINWKATGFFGLHRNELNGHRFEEFVVDDEKPRWLREFSSARNLISGEDSNFDLKIAHNDGTIIDVNLTCLRMDDVADEPILRISMVNVTQLKLTESKLLNSEAYLRNIIDNEPECIKIVDATGNLKQMNPAGLAMLEAKTLAQATSIPLSDFVVPEYRKAFADLHKRVIAGEPMQLQYEVIGLKGRRRWMDTHAVPMNEHGVNQVLAVTRDITEQKLAENALRIAAIAFESQEGMLVTDANNVILKVNQAFSTITGYSAEEAIGKHPSLLSSGKHDADFYKAMWKSLKDTGTWQGDIWNKRKSGEVYPEQLGITAVKDNHGVITNYVATLTDITMNKAAAEEIQRLAFYDPLTQLPNRRLLVDRLNQAIVSSARNGVGGAVLFMDLDHFKTLNDSLGHGVGDLMLQQVAERLISCVREGDTVSRLGGDEYVVMLEHLSTQAIEAAAQAEGVAEKILAALNKPFKLAGHEYQNTASIGIALFNDQSQSQEDLLKHADIAMYQSKKAGRNALCFFDPKMQDAIRTRASLKNNLRKALKKKK